MINFIMLTWNRKAFVEKLFDSFYEKISNMYPYEFIIIDNGSTDGTKELLQERGKNDSNIKLIFNDKNEGLNAYKELYKFCNGDYIITIDDDVIEFPENFDFKLIDALTKADKFGFLALDVVQNEQTDGAKHKISEYKDVAVENYIISEGPTGGWCCIVRASDFKRIEKYFMSGKYTMKQGEDGKISRLMRRKLKLKSGLLKDEKCFHACGPYYSQKYGFLDRDIEKYKNGRLNRYVKVYRSFKKKENKF